MSARSDLLLTLADDELILGWRDSEWTGIAPTLEEDVAFSSIAQNEIGHARALYELAAAELDTDADALAFDRDPAEYACAPLVELRLLDDWSMTIARRYLYEQADRVRITVLVGSSDRELAGLAAKIDREEVYHRLHAELWADRLAGEPRFEASVEKLWPYAVGMLPSDQQDELALLVGRPIPSNSLLQGRARGGHTSELEALWLEMTEVRRSIPGAQW